MKNKNDECTVKCQHGKPCISKGHKTKRPHNTGCCLVAILKGK